MGVSKNRGNPPQKNVWFTMKNPIKIHDLWGFPLFLETPKSYPAPCPTSSPHLMKDMPTLQLTPGLPENLQNRSR